MALKPEDIKWKLDATPEDLKLADTMELQIDDYLNRNYQGRALTFKLRVDLNNAVCRELQKRYLAAGWKNADIYYEPNHGTYVGIK